MSNLNENESMKTVWFSREDYSKIRELLTDSERLPDDYEQWEKLNEKLFDGVEIEKIYVEPDAFVNWCETQGIAPSFTACRKYIVKR